MKRCNVMLLAVAVVISLALCSSALAQMATTGAVDVEIATVDTEALPGVVCELSTGTYVRTTVSDARGRALFRFVPVGQYQFKATLPGFDDYVRPGIAVSLGATTRLNVRLKVAKQDKLF